MAMHLEKDSFLQLIRQSLTKDEYKEKLTSLILSALFENEGVNCQKSEPYTKEESTQTEFTNEESPLITENCTENVILNVEPNNENIVVSRDYEKPNNFQHYRFDPYCSRFLAEDEEPLWDQLRERTRSRSRSSSRSTIGTRSSSSGRRRASRSRSVRSRSRSRTSSRSSRRRRRASPSFMESRRITSARRMPVPYTRARPERAARNENVY